MSKARKLFATFAVALAAGGALVPVASADETTATYQALYYTQRVVSTGNRHLIIRVYQRAAYYSNWCIDNGVYNDPCQFWVAVDAFIQPYAMLSL